MHKTLVEIHQDVPADHYDRGIKNNLLQRLWHNRRFAEVMTVIKPVEGAILDIGCHGGVFTEKILTKTGSQKIYGIDISSAAIKLIAKRLPFGYFEVADAAKSPFKNNFFDAVFCLEMLEHVDNPMQVLLEIKRVLKKRGYGVILVPADTRLFKIIWFLWTWRYSVWRHAHVNSFQQNDLEKALKKIKFKIINVKKINLGMLKIVVFQK